MSFKKVKELIEGAGGKVNEDSMAVLPDGSGCCTASFPLPEDHWIYKGVEVPPMGLRCTDPQLRRELKEIIYAAGKYAVCGATMSGKDMDFDPDALLQNLVVGLLGFWSHDALSHDSDPDPEKRYEPNPDPPPLPVVAIVRGT